MLTASDLNALSARIHEANNKWWISIEDGVTPLDRNKGELIMLMVSEIAEAMEGERKNLMDDKLPHRKMAEVEMADCFIRIMDYWGGFGFSLPETFGELRLLEAMPENKGQALMDITMGLSAAYFSAEYNKLKASFITPIRAIFTYCNVHSYDLLGAMEEKLAYNAQREDHKHEARLLAEGKKW